MKVRKIRVGDAIGNVEIDRDQFHRWISSLIREKYPQAKGALQTERGYCCLGVGCVETTSSDKLYKNERLYLRGSLPKEQGNAPLWLKCINIDFQQRTGYGLDNLNDCHNLTHKDIGNLLKKIYIEGHEKPAELVEEAINAKIS